MRKKLTVIRVISVIVTAIGLVMLACGLMLRYFIAERRYAADNAQMPEEYIEEFFSDEVGKSSIEDYIEPAYDE